MFTEQKRKTKCKSQKLNNVKMEAYPRKKQNGRDLLYELVWKARDKQIKINKPIKNSSSMPTNPGECKPTSQTMLGLF